MRSSIDTTVEYVHDTAFKASTTFIEYHAVKKHECRIMERIMHRLEAECTQDRDTAPFYFYKVNKPPYFALNILETEGFNVVGTNSVSNLLIWTLQGQLQPPCHTFNDTSNWSKVKVIQNVFLSMFDDCSQTLLLADYSIQFLFICIDTDTYTPSKLSANSLPPGRGALSD